MPNCFESSVFQFFRATYDSKVGDPASFIENDMQCDVAEDIGLHGLFWAFGRIGPDQQPLEVERGDFPASGAGWETEGTIRPREVKGYGEGSVGIHWLAFSRPGTEAPPVESFLGGLL